MFCYVIGTLLQCMDGSYAYITDYNAIAREQQRTTAQIYNMINEQSRRRHERQMQRQQALSPAPRRLHDYVAECVMQYVPEKRQWCIDLYQLEQEVER